MSMAHGLIRHRGQVVGTKFRDIFATRLLFGKAREEIILEPEAWLSDVT